MAFIDWRGVRKSSDRHLRNRRRSPTSRRRPRLEPLEQRRLLAVVGGFSNEGTLPANDDGSSDSAASIGFTANLFGASFNSVFVNNNGNITIDNPLSGYSPSPLSALGEEIIAPFWADVDTRANSGLVTYGTGTIDGRNAFGVEWPGVNYYEATATDPQHVDLFNTFELVLIDRSTDPGNSPGDFDIEFNYDAINWETGDASGGVNGLGGDSARVGYSNGTDQSFELPGSGTPGAFLDGGPNALVSNSQGSNVPGRYIFAVRNGTIDAPLTAGTKPSINVNEGDDTGSITVAAFSDGDANGTADQFTAGTTIDWGDGTVTPADGITGTPGQFNVVGHHTYKEGGKYPVTVTVVDSGGSTTTINGTATVADAPLSINDTTGVSATEGASYTTDLLTFSDADKSNPAPGNYTVTVDYGDGTAIQTVTPRQDGGAGSAFEVPADHKFEKAGSLTVHVTIVDNSDQTVPKQTITADIPAFINDADLSITPNTPTGVTEGQSFTQLLGTFSDADSTKQGKVGNYSVFVDWGDGETISQDDPNLSIAPSSSAGGAAFSITGTHTYTEEGPEVIKVYVTDLSGGASASTATSSFTVTVADATLDASAVSVSAAVGTPFTGAVATFTDANPNPDMQDFSGTIDWNGDGSQVDTFGPANVSGSGGVYTVTGTHTYSVAGTPTINVTINDKGGATTAVGSQATVSAQTGHINFDVIQPVDGTQQDIGFIDATTMLIKNPFGKIVTEMDTSFYLDPNFNYIQGCFQLHWLQVATAVSNDTTKTFHTTPVNLLTPIDDPPKDGYDPLGSDDNQPWYWNATEEKGHFQMTAAGTQVFSMDDEPSATGASFDTWLVASYIGINGPAFSVLGGFHWNGGINGGTFGGPATLAVNGAPDLAVITTALTNARFTGYTPTTNTDLGCHDIDFQFPGPSDVTRGVPIPANQVISNVTDRADPNPAVNNFSAVTVNWGDGSPTEQANLTQTGQISFNLNSLGGHTYNQNGNFTVTVSITQISGTTFTGTTTISVHDLAAFPRLFSVTEGVETTVAVATFADSDPSATEGNFSISIDWGDGTPMSSGSAVANGGGNFTVMGTHLYFEQQTTQPVNVFINDSDGDTATANSAAQVVDAPLHSVGDPTTYTVREGDVNNNFVVATFTDDDTQSTPDDYVASVNWGDGTSATVGTVQREPNSSTRFQVLGSHQYADESPGAAPFVVTVTIDDEPGNPAGSSTVIATNASFVVTDAPLEPNAAVIVPTEMAVFTGVVGTFVDDSPTANAADFTTVSIDWGDGTPTTTGTVTATLQDLNSVHFNVTGTHTYTEEGSRSIKITLVDDGGTTGTINSVANVADAPITASGVPGGLSLTEGSTFSGLVATFTDAGTDGTINDYLSTTINWGDGTVTPATVALGAGGVFNVTGSHVYEDGVRTITVKVVDVGGSTATASTSVSVADAPLTISATTNPVITPLPLSVNNAFPQEIISGPGGNLWFIEQNTGKLGRIDPKTAVLTEFTLPDFSGNATGITNGPDGALWFAETNHNKIGRFDPTTDAITEFNVPTANSFPTGITTGADGKLWFTERTAQKIGRLDPATGTIVEFQLPSNNAVPFDITLGPDGNVWFTTAALAGQGVARIQPSGTITEFTTTTVTDALVNDMVSADGAIWITESAANVIARISPSGVVTQFSVPTANSNPQGITADSNGNLWFTELDARQIGKLTPGGVFTEFPLPNAASRPTNITLGGDGYLWYTDSGTNSVSQFVPPAGQSSFTAGVAFTAALASFTDAFTAAPITDFTAPINWGDGATSAGILIAKGGGAFDVKGTHTYTHAGNFTVSGVIRDTGGSTATFSESLAVSAPVTLTSSVAALPATETSTTFTVSWSGTDVGGPGIAHYDVFVADNGGPFTPFQSFATSTSATFTGVNGHTYGFYSVATDNVGNRQATPTAAQATTAVSVVTALPTSHVAALALLSPATFTVSWVGSDVGGPGISSFDVYVSDNNGPFTALLTGTTATSTTFNGANGHTYGFYSVATDTAGNHQVTPASAQATTVVATDPNQRYVGAVYQDVLGRAPDAGGESYWTQLLDSGMTASSIAEAIAHSDEYYANFVIRPAYVNLLGRSADGGGVSFWTTQMDTGVTDQELEADLVSAGGTSGEFYKNAGGTNTAWIDAVYRLLLGRSADATGENFWNSQLAAGATLNQVAQGIAGSQENNTNLINDDYFHYLGRTSDAGGLAFWLSQFAAGKTNEDVIAGFTGSAEYYNDHTR